MLHLSAGCRIHAERNQFSAETVGAIQQRLQAIRTEDARLGPHILFSINDASSHFATKSLEESMIFWLREFQRVYPSRCQDPSHYPSADSSKERECLTNYHQLISHADKEKLHAFLDRLKSIKDYKDGGDKRNNVILRVGQMLERGASNAVFCCNLFTILEDALSTCGDRITLAFNDIEIQWHLSQSNSLSDRKFIELLVGLKRIDILKAIAAKRVEELKLGDAIEVHLYYQVNLKDALHLPLSTSEMLYPAMAAAISDELLLNDRNEVLQATLSSEQIVAILMEYEPWKKKMQESREAEFEDINTRIVDEIEYVKNEKISENDRIKKINELSQKREEMTNILLKKFTAESVEKYFEKGKETANSVVEEITPVVQEPEKIESEAQNTENERKNDFNKRKLSELEKLDLDMDDEEQDELELPTKKQRFENNE